MLALLMQLSFLSRHTLHWPLWATLYFDLLPNSVSKKWWFCLLYKSACIRHLLKLFLFCIEFVCADVFSNGHETHLFLDLRSLPFWKKTKMNRQESLFKRCFYVAKPTFFTWNDVSLEEQQQEKTSPFHKMILRQGDWFLSTCCFCKETDLTSPIWMSPWCLGIKFLSCTFWHFCVINLTFHSAKLQMEQTFGFC